MNSEALTYLRAQLDRFAADIAAATNQPVQSFKADRGLLSV